MKYLCFLLVLIVQNLVVAGPVQQILKQDEIVTSVPSKEEAAKVARTLVARESLANINTFHTVESDNGSSALLPVSSMEYYADCDLDGNPYWLVVDIGSTYQNILHGSDYTISIRVGDHPTTDHGVNPEYPGGIVSSPAGSPRVNLQGTLKNVTFSNPLDLLKLEKCFVKRHPDSKWWLPNIAVSPHKTHWMKFEVSEVYMIGGFGDRAYIGSIDGETYHEASILDSSV